MRLGCIYRKDAVAQAFYRAAAPMDALQAHGHQVVWWGPSDSIDAERLRLCEVLHVQRAAEPWVLKLIDELSTRGVAVNWDNDDDIRALPKESPTYKKLGGLAAERDFAMQARMIRRADLVTAPSEALAEQYREVGAADVRVIENYLPEQFARADRRGNDGLVIGWVAGNEHIVDAKRLGLNAVLRDVLEAHPHVRMVTVGLDIGLGHERYERWPGTSVDQLTQTIGAFDIGLAPLADIRFNRCRSTVKLKEYAAVGIPWLASPVGEYASLGPRQGGRLVSDDGWRQALERMIRSTVDRFVLAKRGKRWAKGQTMELNVGEWERAFEEAISRAGTRRGRRDPAASSPPRRGRRPG